MYADSAFALEAPAAFVSLQGLVTLVAEQRFRLSGSIDTYCRMSRMKAPLDENQITDINATHPGAKSGSFVLTHEQVRSRVGGLVM